MKTWSWLEDLVTNEGNARLNDAKRDGLPRDLLDAALPPLPAEAHRDRLYLACATRFLFSALVDADSLDTEAWDHERSRDTEFSSIAELANVTERACLLKLATALATVDSAQLRAPGGVSREAFRRLQQYTVSLQPAEMTLEEQGRFALGYYHQRQSFFRSSKPTDSAPEETIPTHEGDPA